MEPNETGRQVCNNCGSPLQPEHRFCPNCGTAVSRDAATEPREPKVQGPFDSIRPIGEPVEQPADPAPDPSIMETREHVSQDYQSPLAQEHEPEAQPASAEFQQSADPTWGTPETTVPPERGNRTLWIILSIIAFIILICCCVLPLTLMVISNVDSGFQDQVRSTVTTLSAF